MFVKPVVLPLFKTIDMVLALLVDHGSADIDVRHYCLNRFNVLRVANLELFRNSSIHWRSFGSVPVKDLLCNRNFADPVHVFRNLAARRIMNQEHSEETEVMLAGGNPNLARNFDPFNLKLFR